MLFVPRLCWCVFSCHFFVRRKWQCRNCKAEKSYSLMLFSTLGPSSLPVVWPRKTKVQHLVQTKKTAPFRSRWFYSYIPVNLNYNQPDSEDREGFFCCHLVEVPWQKNRKYHAWNRDRPIYRSIDIFVCLSTVQFEPNSYWWRNNVRIWLNFDQQIFSCLVNTTLLCTFCLYEVCLKSNGTGPRSSIQGSAVWWVDRTRRSMIHHQ